MNNLAIDYEDSIDLLIEIEKGFSIKISDVEAPAITTMGDLFDLVIDKLPSPHGEKCMTSMTFYRLKRVVSEFDPTLKLRPDMHLRDISNLTPKSLFKVIHQKTNFVMPPLQCTAMGNVGAVILLVSFLFIIAALLFIIAELVGISIVMGSLATAGIVGSIVLVRHDPLAFPDNMTTVRNLANKIAKRNYGNFIKQGAKFDSNSLWDALVELVRSYSESSPKHIDRETKLIMP